MRVTLKDIARKLGLTEATVSMALRNYPNISPATIKKVQEVARELGYKPNLAARNLRRSSTKVIGLVLPDVIYDFSQQIIDGVKSVLLKRGYTPMMAVSAWDANQEDSDIDCLLGYQVEGMICLPTVGSEKIYQRVLDVNVPLVFVGNGLNLPSAGWISMDGYDAACQLVDHLVGLGHKRIAFIGTDTTANSMALSLRLNGYKSALKEHGIAADDDLILSSALGKLETVYSLVKQLLKLPNPPTAIFAISDPIAYSVMDALYKLDVKIPDDIAVTGMGDLLPSKFEYISLTTVVDNGRLIGEKAAELIVNCLENENYQYIQEKVKGALKIRRSTVGDL